MRPVHVALIKSTSHNACLCAKYQNLKVLILLLAILKNAFPHLWDCYCQFNYICCIGKSILVKKGKEDVMVKKMKIDEIELQKRIL